MIASMTGFGRGESKTGKRQISIEIKSLNSKQLDLIIKLPARYRRLEGELRNLITAACQRGKVEVVVSTELMADAPSSTLNIPLLQQYKKEIEDMDHILGIPVPEDWHSVLLRMPEVMKPEDSDIDAEEEEAFKTSAEEALGAMMKYREDEGKKLYGFFCQKIENIRNLLKEVEPFEEGRVGKIKARIYDQLEKLSGVEVDNGRLEQELIYYIEKLDISEEKQRLSTHLDYFMETMGAETEGSAGAKGKKLGFIAQEMGREINTLGSKSNNAEMQIIVVKMKDELEQIKEQVLNVL